MDNFEWLAHNSALFGLVLKIDLCAEWDGYLRKADANYCKSPSFRRLLGGGMWEESYWIIRNRKEQGFLKRLLDFFHDHQANIDPFPKNHHPTVSRSQDCARTGLLTRKITFGEFRYGNRAFQRPLTFQPGSFPVLGAFHGSFLKKGVIFHHHSYLGFKNWHPGLEVAEREIYIYNIYWKYVKFYIYCTN